MATGTFAMLQKAFSECTVSRGTTFRWCERFTADLKSVKDQNRCGRPSTSSIIDNVAKVKKIVMNNYRYTVRELAGDAGLRGVAIK